MKTTPWSASLLSTLLLGFAAHAAWAAPALLVTKPSVTPNPSWTGPVQDPHAVQGQWFKNLAGVEEVRPLEFYDDILGNGGGTASYSAIKGVVTQVTTDPSSGNITSFAVFTSITNDTPATTDWQPGSNSHGELLDTPDQYVGTLRGTKLTVEFAISNLNNIPSWTAPYWQGEASQYNPPVYIVGQNYDQLAWYCWTPDNPDEKTPYGDYFIPTYDFGDIAPGQTVTRTLSFATTGAGIAPGENRFYRIMESYNLSYDIFLNRSSDLKIGSWLDTLDLDTGQPYWSQNSFVLRAGNVSVFATPEPATLALLGLAASALLARRARRARKA